MKMHHNRREQILNGLPVFTVLFTNIDILR